MEKYEELKKVLLGIKIDRSVLTVISKERLGAKFEATVLEGEIDSLISNPESFEKYSQIENLCKLYEKFLLERHNAFLTSYFEDVYKKECLSKDKILSCMTEQDLKRNNVKLTPDLVVVREYSVDIIDATTSISQNVVDSKKRRYLDMCHEFSNVLKKIGNVIVWDYSKKSSLSPHYLNILNNYDSLLRFFEQTNHGRNALNNLKSESKGLSETLNESFPKFELDIKEYLKDSKVEKFFPDDVSSLHDGEDFFPDSDSELSLKFYKMCLAEMAERAKEGKSRYVETTSTEVNGACDKLKERYMKTSVFKKANNKILPFHVNTSVSREKTQKISLPEGCMHDLSDLLDEKTYECLAKLIHLSGCEGSKIETDDINKSFFYHMRSQYDKEQKNELVNPLNGNFKDIVEFLRELSSFDGNFNDILLEKITDLMNKIRNSVKNEVLVNSLNEEKFHSFLKIRVFNFLAVFSRICEQCLFLGSRDTRDKKVVASNCGFSDTMLVTSSGKSFVKSDKNRSFMLIQRFDRDSSNIGKNPVVTGDIIINYFSMNREKLSHLQHALDAFVCQNFYIINDLKGNSFQLNALDQLHYFAVRPLIFMTAKRTLSDHITNERYIKLALTSKFSCISEFIEEKMFLPCRDRVSAFFMKRVFENMDSIVKGLQAGKKFTVGNLPRLFSFGSNSNVEEAITGLYDGYLISKKRMSDIHSLFKAVEKLAEMNETFEDYVEDDFFLKALRGYSSKKFDLEEEFLLFKMMLDSKKKFFVHRWFLKVLSRQKYKKEIANQNFSLSNMNLSELHADLESYATTKSSFDKLDKDTIAIYRKIMESQEKGGKLKYSDNDKKIQYNLKESGLNRIGKIKTTRNGRPVTLTKETRERFEVRSTTTLKVSDLIKESDYKNLNLMEAIIKNFIDHNTDLISLVAKDQYCGDREIAIMHIIQRLRLRLIEIFSEELTRYFNEDVVKDKLKFKNHADKVRLSNQILEKSQNNYNKQYIQTYWNLDKTRWGPGLMPIHFSDMLTEILKDALDPKIIKLIKAILINFHNKKIVVPERIVAIWTKNSGKVEQLRLDRGNIESSEEVEEFWRKAQENFRFNGEVEIPVFTGMMQGLLQQTSSIYHCLKIFLEREIVSCMGINLNEERPFEHNMVTSDDSIKIMVSTKSFLSQMMSVSEISGKSMNIFDNFKKSNIHSCVSELNQNFVDSGIETGVPIKTIGRSMESLPSSDYSDIVMHVSSMIASDARKNMSLLSTTFVLCWFTSKIERKFGMSDDCINMGEGFNNRKLNLYELPLQMGGKTEILPLTFKMFGFKYDLLYKTMYKNSVISRKFLKIGNEEDNEDGKSPNLPSIRTLGHSTTALSNVRKAILENHLGFFKDVMEDNGYKNILSGVDIPEHETEEYFLDSVTRLCNVLKSELSANYNNEVSKLVNSLDKTRKFGKEDYQSVIQSIINIIDRYMALEGIVDKGNREEAFLDNMKSRLLSLFKNIEQFDEHEFRIFDFFKRYRSSLLHTYNMLKSEKQNLKILEILTKYFSNKAYMMFEKQNSVKVQIDWACHKTKSFQFMKDQKALDEIIMKSMTILNNKVKGFKDAVIESYNIIDNMFEDSSVDDILFSTSAFKNLNQSKEFMNFVIADELSTKVSNNYEVIPLTMPKFHMIESISTSQKNIGDCRSVLLSQWNLTKKSKKCSKVDEENFYELQSLYPKLRPTMEETIKDSFKSDISAFNEYIEFALKGRPTKRVAVYSDMSVEDSERKTRNSILSDFIQNEFQRNLVKRRQYPTMRSKISKIVKEDNTLNQSLCDDFCAGYYLAKDKELFKEKFFKQFGEEVGKFRETMIAYSDRYDWIKNRNAVLMLGEFDKSINVWDFFKKMNENSVFFSYLTAQGFDIVNNEIKYRTEDPFDVVYSSKDINFRLIANGPKSKLYYHSDRSLNTTIEAVKYVVGWLVDKQNINVKTLASIILSEKYVNLDSKRNLRKQRADYAKEVLMKSRSFKDRDFLVICTEIAKTFDARGSVEKSDRKVVMANRYKIPDTLTYVVNYTVKDKIVEKSTRVQMHPYLLVDKKYLNRLENIENRYGQDHISKLLDQYNSPIKYDVDNVEDFLMSSECKEIIECTTTTERQSSLKRLLNFQQFNNINVPTVRRVAESYAKDIIRGRSIKGEVDMKENVNELSRTLFEEFPELLQIVTDAVDQELEKHNCSWGERSDIIDDLIFLFKNVKGLSLPKQQCDIDSFTKEMKKNGVHFFRHIRELQDDSEEDEDDFFSFKSLTDEEKESIRFNSIFFYTTLLISRAISEKANDTPGESYRSMIDQTDDSVFKKAALEVAQVVERNQEEFQKEIEEFQMRNQSEYFKTRSNHRFWTNMTFKGYTADDYERLIIPEELFKRITQKIDFSLIDKPNQNIVMLLLYNSKYGHQLDGLNYHNLRKEIYDYIVQVVDALKLLWLVHKNLIKVAGKGENTGDIEQLHLGELRFPTVYSKKETQDKYLHELF